MSKRQADKPSELARRAFARIDRRVPGLMRRGGRGAGGSSDDGASVVTQLLLYGLRSFSAANYYATQSGGGEAGVSTGFGQCVVWRLDTMPSTASQALAGRTNNSNAGYSLYLPSNQQSLIGYANNTGGAFAQTSLDKFVASDVGKLFCSIEQHEGTALRLYNRRGLVGTAADAASGFAPHTGPDNIGSLSGSLPATSATIIGRITWRGIADLAAIQALSDAVRTTGNVPSAVAGVTVTHRISLPDALAGTTVVSGQTAPATLADTVTLETADAMTRTGSPTVVTIDTSVDGRKTYGVQGFSIGNMLSTAAGIRGHASGFWLAAYVQFTSISGNNSIASAINATTGWDFVQYGGTLLLGVRVNGGFYNSAQPYTFSAGDIGQPMLVVFVSTGTAFRAYVRGVQAGTDTAHGAMMATTASMLLGTQAAQYPATNMTIFGACGGDGVIPTAAEMLQLNADTVATGRIGTIAGKTFKRWDLHQDIDANGGPVNGVPAQLLDRSAGGTDHLARVGIEVKSTANAIRAVGPYAMGHYWQSAPGAAITGANTGFHVVIDLWFTAVPTAGTVFSYSNGSNGYYLTINPSGMRFTLPGFVATGYFVLTAAHLNKRIRVVCQKTATHIQMQVNGVAVADVAAASYTAPAATVPLVVGAYAFNSDPLTVGYVELLQGGNAELSSGEVAALFTDLTAAPPITASKTLKRWRFEQDIAASGGVLPGFSVERIAGGDNLVRINAPTVAAQRIDRVWNHEVSPILYGAGGLSLADYFESAAGFAGDNAGFWVCALFMITAQGTGNVASAVRTLFARRSSGAGPGWQLQTSGPNGTMAFGCGGTGGSASVASGNYVFSATDVGKLLLVHGVWDPTALAARLYCKRVLVGSGTFTNGTYVPEACNTQIGRRPTLGLPADYTTIFGVAAGLGVPTLTEIHAHSDEAMASEELARGIPGKTSLVVNLKADVAANGGAMPAQLLDRAGTAHFTRAGNPSLASQFARTWGW